MKRERVVAHVTLGHEVVVKRSVVETLSVVVAEEMRLIPVTVVETMEWWCRTCGGTLAVGRIEGIGSPL